MKENAKNMHKLEESLCGHVPIIPIINMPNNLF
jgi:hypothetical protein